MVLQALAYQPIFGAEEGGRKGPTNFRIAMISGVKVPGVITSGEMGSGFHSQPVDF